MFIKNDIIFKNMQKIKDNFYCTVCKLPLVSQQDFEKNELFECCQNCFLNFVESRKEDWIAGWRPEKSVLRKKINFRKQVMTKINNK